MKVTHRSCLSALALLFAAGSTAQTLPSQLNAFGLNSLLNALSANRSFSLYSGTPNACDVGVRCNVTITPQQLFDINGNLKACVITVGDIMIRTPAGTTRDKVTEIHWSIDPSQITGPTTVAKFTFQTAGLVVFKDDDDATLKKACSVTDDELVLKHKFRRHGAKVVYYPLVFQQIGTDPPMLCGSSDPTIANN